MKEQNYLDHLVGVFGHPAAENPGVVIQEAAFRDLGLKHWHFLTIDVDPGKLGDAILGLKAMKFRGINCTIPHKKTTVAKTNSSPITWQRIWVIELIILENVVIKAL